MKMITAFVLGVLLITHPSCKTESSTCSSKTVTCKAFDDADFYILFPYVNNQEIIFKNPATGDTLTYKVNQTYRSDSYEIDIGGFSSSSGNCNAHGDVSATALTGQAKSLNISYDKFENATSNTSSQSLRIYLNTSAFDAGKIEKNNLSPSLNSPTATSIVTNYSVAFPNGITYPSVYILSIDTTFIKDNRPYRLYLSKNAGIIGFDEYPSNKKWVKQ